MQVVHSIPPVFDKESRVLILGSFPSVRSREVGFFYGHPQNRFWRVIAGVYEVPTPTTVEEKAAFLHAYHIALWDVIASCEIVGSADSSIRNVIPNDVGSILRQAPIKRIFVNGKTAQKYYNQYLRDTLGREAVCLPSTSPANASWSLERLLATWRAELE